MKPQATLRLTFSWRRIAPKFGTGLLVASSILLLGLNRVDPSMIERMQVATSDFLAPALSFMGRPLGSIRVALDGVAHLRNVYSDNADLRQNNARLLAWRDAALRLEAENAALRAQLHVAPDPAITETTARVVGDPAGGFVQSLMLAAGALDGIEKGRPAVTSAAVPGEPALGALAGRVVQVGDHSSRLLLVTDVNSRIPVELDQSHVHAILAGDNGDRPKLLFLPPGATVNPGERVVTSGNDRLLPPGIPVGVVVSDGEDGVRVAPLADLSRLEFVSILKFQGVDPLAPPETPVQGEKTRRRS